MSKSQNILIKESKNNKFGEEIITFNGEFHDMSGCIKMNIVPNPKRDSEKSPEFIVRTRNKQGTVIKIGAAWVHTNDETGQQSLAIGVDDRSFSEKLWLKAYESKERQNVYDLVWRRKVAAKADNGNGNNSDNIDDEIPY